MARQWDYDGHINRWDTFGILPPDVLDFIDTVSKEARKSQKIVVWRDSNGLIAAGLAERGFYVSLLTEPSDVIPQKVWRGDVQVPAYEAPIRPRAKGAYETIEADPKQLFDYLDERTVLVGRKTLQYVYSNEWMDGVIEAGVPLLVSAPLDGGDHLFNSIDVETAWLKSRDWTTHVSRNGVIYADRAANSSSK